MHSLDNNISWTNFYCELVEQELQIIASKREPTVEIIKCFKATLKQGVKAGFQVNGNLESLDTKPLHYAAEKGCLMIAYFLKKLHADSNGYDNSLKTPLFKAVNHNQKEMVELLLKKLEANPLLFSLKENILPITIATNPEIIRLFKNAYLCNLALGPINNKYTPFHWNVTIVNVEGIKALIECGFADAYCNNESALELAQRLQKDPAYSNKLQKLEEIFKLLSQHTIRYGTKESSFPTNHEDKETAIVLFKPQSSFFNKTITSIRNFLSMMKLI